MLWNYNKSSASVLLIYRKWYIYTFQGMNELEEGSRRWANIATLLIAQYLMNHTLLRTVPALFQYNLFHTHSHTAPPGFICGCLSSFTLFSLRPIRLTALLVESSLVWCGAFHYTGYGTVGWCLWGEKQLKTEIGQLNNSGNRDFGIRA